MLQAGSFADFRGMVRHHVPALGEVHERLDRGRQQDTARLTARSPIGIVALEHLLAAQIERRDLDPGIQFVEVGDHRRPVVLRQHGVDQQRILFLRVLDELLVIFRVIIRQGLGAGRGRGSQQAHADPERQMKRASARRCRFGRGHHGLPPWLRRSFDRTRCSDRPCPPRSSPVNLSAGRIVHAQRQEPADRFSP